MCEAVVLVNRRAKQTPAHVLTNPQATPGEWVDAEPTRHRIKAWKTLAEHLANLPKGTTVLVVGTISTDTWTDKDTGQKRTSDVVVVDAIGASLRFTDVYPASAHRQPSTPSTEAN